MGNPELGRRAEKRIEKSGESDVEKELAEVESRVLLHFTRHGEKEKVPGVPNAEQLLTPAGRMQALDKGKKRGKAHPTAMAMGSDILRAQQTAGFEMAGAGGIDDITGEETLEELREKLDEGRKYGTRLGQDARIGFHFSTDEYREIVERVVGKEKRGMRFMIDESNELAKKLGETGGYTYDEVSANFAKVIKKYVGVEKNFNTLVQTPEKKEEYGDTLERFLASHAGIMDTFLCKLIEKVKGVAEREKFVEALGGQGFDFAEGFDIEIDTLKDSPEPSIRLSYERKDDDGNILFSFNEAVPMEVIDGLIKEGTSTS